MKTQVKYRVIFVSPFNGNTIMLFSSDNYEAAEEFCANYTGSDTLEIKKVWIPKLSEVLE